MTTDDTIDALRDELQRVRLERAGLLSDIEQLRAELARLRIENEGLRAKLAAMPKGKRGTRRRKTEPVTPAPAATETAASLAAEAEAPLEDLTKRTAAPFGARFFNVNGTTLIMLVYRFDKNIDDVKCEVAHTALPMSRSQFSTRARRAREDSMTNSDYTKSLVVITLAVVALVAFMTWAAVPKQRGPSDAAMSGPIFQPVYQKVY